MNHNMILIVCLCFLVCLPRTETNVAAVLTVFKTGLDIFKAGFQIVDFIRKLNSDKPEDLKEVLEEIRTDLNRMIRSSTTTIIKEITLQNKLAKIEDTVSEIQSLLIDMENYIEAENEVDRQSYKTLFLKRFDQRVVAQIRNLPSLLAYNIPGFSEPLIYLIRDKAQCNMTAIHEFQMFYANLLADGSTLQLVFRELSNYTSDDVQEFWNEHLPNIQVQFDGMETTCKERFPKNAEEEIKQNIDARALYNNSKQRYTWAWCNVYYYPPMGTHQFHFHKSVSDFLFWNGASSSGRNQIMVIGDIDKIEQSWNKNDMNAALASNVDKFKSVISGSEDTSAALKVGDAVENFVKDKGFLIKGVVVFFDTPSLASTVRIVDDSSSAAYVVIEGVALKFCYNNGLVCTITQSEWFNYWETYTGRFHIYVFPCTTSDTDESSRPDCFEHTTGAANSNIRSFPGFILYMVCMTYITVASLANKRLLPYLP